jgi:hypothetical protein
MQSEVDTPRKRTPALFAAGILYLVSAILIGIFAYWSPIAAGVIFLGAWMFGVEGWNALYSILAIALFLLPLAAFILLMDGTNCILWQQNLRRALKDGFLCLAVMLTLFIGFYQIAFNLPWPYILMWLAPAPLIIGMLIVQHIKSRIDVGAPAVSHQSVL